MKIVNISGAHQFLGEGGLQKNNIYGELPKKRGGRRQFPGGLAKIGRRVSLSGVDTWMHTMTWFWYMAELKVGLADVSTLNFDQSFLQFNAKKKISAKETSQFEFKCWILKAVSINIQSIAIK